MTLYKLCSVCGRNRPMSCFPQTKEGWSIKCCDCMYKATSDLYHELQILGVRD